MRWRYCSIAKANLILFQLHRGLHIMWHHIGAVEAMPQHFKSLVTQIFVQQLLQTYKKQYVKALHNWPYVKEIHLWLADFPQTGPGPCIINVFATRRKNFSQWHRSFQRKLLSHWLKFLRHVAITLVIQDPVTQEAFSCHAIIMKRDLFPFPC